MILRDLTAADTPAILAINEASTPGVLTSTAAELAELTAMSCIALAVEIDGKVAGFCQVLPPGTTYDSSNYLFFVEKYRDFVYLDRVAVAPEHRGRGIGTLLYDEVEKRTGAQWFTCEVNLRPKNDGSLRFHARRGFVEVGQHETDYGALVSLVAKKLR